MVVSYRKFYSFSLVVWLAITVYGIYFLSNLQHQINFGIDLVGGTYITLEVKSDKLLEGELIERVAPQLKEFVEKQGSISITQRYESEKLLITFPNENVARSFEQLSSERIGREVHITREASTIAYALIDITKKQLIQEAVEGNIAVLRTRIDRFGVGEVSIAAQGERHIVVELPNVQDVRKAKALIGTSALLEVKSVLDVASSPEELLQKYGNCLPEGTEMVPGRETDQGKSYYLVPHYTDLTGKLLKTARSNASGGKFGIEPVIEFEFKPEGGEKFYALTSKGSNPFIAMIVDGVVVTAATAREPLRTRGEISGNFTLEETQELASLLRSGAFVAPVTFEEDRTIGPSLGYDSIHKGLVSCLIGLVLLFIFSVSMYKMAGLFAFVVLLYNLLFILFFLSWLGATLTLPGIAGMVLTIGMAIDSSILIYERIREELAQGSSFKTALEIGFSGATTVILDANITHFLVAVVLYKLGAGAIQGFAVTMIVGIIATLLTGLVLLRAIFDYLINNLNIKKISI